MKTYGLHDKDSVFDTYKKFQLSEQKIDRMLKLNNILSLLGIKYILLPNNQNLSGINIDKVCIDKDKYYIKKVDNNVILLENKRFLPRFFIINDFKIVKGENEAFNMLVKSKTDFSKNTIIEESVDNDNNKSRLPNKSKIELIRYKPNEINIKAWTKNKSIMILSDSHYPGWEAYNNEKKVKIYRANYLFRAIKLKPGLNDISPLDHTS